MEITNVLSAKDARNIVINCTKPQRVPQSVFDKIKQASESASLKTMYICGTDKLQAVHWQKELKLLGYDVTLISVGGEYTEYSLMIEW